MAAALCLLPKPPLLLLCCCCVAALWEVDGLADSGLPIKPDIIPLEAMRSARPVSRFTTVLMVEMVAFVCDDDDRWGKKHKQRSTHNLYRAFSLFPFLYAGQHISLI